MKRKSLLKKILFSTLASISFIKAADDEKNITGYPGQYELSLAIPPSDLKFAIESRFPSLLGGYRDSAVMPLALMRTFAKVQISDPVCIIQPDAAPLFSWMQRQIQTMAPEFPQLQYLVAELADNIKSGRFDVVTLYTYGFRVLAAISGEPTQDALAVFSSFGGDEIDRNARTNWQSPFSLLAITEQDELASVSVPTNLSQRLRNLVDDTTAKVGRVSVPSYPVFGRGKMGLVTLIEAFINRVYPMPVTSKNLTAHGIGMTPFLFGLHDYLHAYGDQASKDAAFDSAAYTRLEKLADGKIDVDDLVLPVVTYMTAKSNLIEDSLSQLVDLYFTAYLPTYTMAHLKKAMVGFFVTMHEDLNISPQIFDLANFDDILKLILGEAVNEQNDILKTDPITGKTSLSAEQVLDAILAAGLPAKEQRYYYTPELRFKRADLTGKTYRIDITESPMMTTVKVKVAGGVEYTWQIETLKYELADALDDVALLNIAGIKITPPTEETLSAENGRDAALAYLQKVSDGMNICRSFFKESASDLLMYTPLGKTKSLWQTFWDKSKKLEKKLADDVSKIN